MNLAEYHKTPDRDFVGKTVRATQRIGTRGGLTADVGTVLTIQRKRGGFTLAAPFCPLCSIAFRIVGVAPSLVDLAPGAEPVRSDGVGFIAAERRRQIEDEGFTPERDQMYGDLDLPFAAACYTLPRHARVTSPPAFWPWSPEWWKPSPVDHVDGRIRELAKAGALIAAEIDRLKAATP